MRKLLSNQAKTAVLILALAIPVCSLAAEDVYSSTLSNQTKQNDPDGKGYILEQVAIWGNKGCVITDGKKTIAPGETSVLKIRKDCEWGGIAYKVLKNNEVIGHVGQSFRNKKFMLETSIPCNGDTCTLTGLTPQSNTAQPANK